MSLRTEQNHAAAPPAAGAAEATRTERSIVNRTIQTTGESGAGGVSRCLEERWVDVGGVARVVRGVVGTLRRGVARAAVGKIDRVLARRRVVALAQLDRARVHERGLLEALRGERLVAAQLELLRRRRRVVPVVVHRRRRRTLRLGVGDVDRLAGGAHFKHGHHAALA
jgi:hypothetical protein